jgi:glycosyltransferase involved in cell wall biosynthesis
MEKKKIEISLIVSTYNWKEALTLCLKSIFRQVYLPKEIIIADDGSREDTKAQIELLRAESPVPMVHIWHEDEGFRLSAIRNKAIAAAQFEYIVQIDGDLVLSETFLLDHAEMAKKGCFLSGSRVLLSQETSAQLLENQSLDVEKYSAGKNRNFFNGKRNSLLRHLLADIYKQYGGNKYYVKGCNMSFWKNDLTEVNGYNENFTGWGREDSEIAIRLINKGLRKRFLKMGGVCFHLWHKEASRELEPRNVAMMNDAINFRKVWAEKGIK